MKAARSSKVGNKSQDNGSLLRVSTVIYYSEFQGRVAIQVVIQVGQFQRVVVQSMEIQRVKLSTKASNITARFKVYRNEDRHNTTSPP